MAKRSHETQHQVLMTNEVEKILTVSCKDLKLNHEYKIIHLEEENGRYGVKAVVTCIDTTEKETKKFKVKLTPFFSINYSTLLEKYEMSKPECYLRLFKISEENGQVYPVYHITRLVDIGFDVIDGGCMSKNHNEVDLPKKNLKSFVLMIGYYLDFEKYSTCEEFNNY